MAEHTRIDTTTEDSSPPVNPGLLWDPAVGISELNADGTTTLLISAGGVPSGISPQAAPAALTDSTTGAPGATLIAVRTDTAAHVAADVIVSLASLNAQLNAVVEALQDAGVLT